MPGSPLRIATLAAAALLIGSLRAAEPDPGGDVEGLQRFEREVRPLLAERCLRCHGRDAQRSGLRLDGRAAMLRGGERGPALVPGDPQASLLLRAVRGHDPELVMPPKGRLSEAQVAQLTAWIAEGAPAPEGDAADVAQRAADGEAFDLWARAEAHWSFQPVGDPAPPAVRDTAWPRRDLDRFVLARLEAERLAPAPPADPETWLRRVSYALSGLPPEPAAQRALLADDSPGTRARVVDGLLASPRFAETWARHWLDVVRYAETRGHEFDYDLPNTWQYRDWVIRALDADLPYDEFITEQVAGDLLDPPRLHPTEGFDESVLGTGMWWLGEEVHSPVDIRLDETDRTANKLDVFGKAFLGLTVACARCHDHKFDPISAADYYALSGVVISSRYRQVRFDTERHNRAVAERLLEWELEHGERVGGVALAALAEHLEAQAPRLLEAAQARVQRGVRPSRVVFDFEHETWDGWDVQGSAFGEGPRRADELADYQGDVGGAGLRVVNTHVISSGEDVRQADAHTGRVTSPVFALDRDVLRLLVGGGDHAGRTCVQLLVDGEVVAEVTGRRDNRLGPAVLDVRPWAGREARLRLVDEETGGWGQLGVDHVELSDDTRGLALAPPAPDDWPAILEAAAHDVLDPFHALARLTQLPVNEWADVVAAWDDARSGSLVGLHGGLPEPPGDPRWIADWRTPARGLELVDGPTFGLVTRGGGTPVFGSDPARPVVAVRTAAGAWARPEWSVLELAAETEPDPSKIEWVQAGRTLHTRTVTLRTGRVSWLAVGAGHVYVSIDGHRMVTGPLHAAAVRSFDAGPRGRWIEHDLSAYVGHRVHFEFSPGDAAEPFAVLAVCEAGAAPPGPREVGDDVALIGFEGLGSPSLRRPGQPDESAPWVPRLQSGWAEDERTILRSFVERLVDALVWEVGELAGSAGLGCDAAQAARVDQLLRLLPPTIEHPSGGLADALVERAAILAEIRPVSRVAPALFDGSGVDEFELLRGSAKTPGELVPRRFLEALGGARRPCVREGSGRLELARQLTDPSDPLVDRAFVNRVWQHLFGRGIVATVDDLGAMGRPPTHPELLDHLVRRFRANGRSLKALVREIVTSSTYAMASAHPDPRAASVDADGSLLSRFGVQRLTAEALRDGLLAVSGRLDTTRFGPGVPLHLTASLAGRGRPARSGPLDGGGRRSIYLQVRRNFLSPLFLAFDFPAPFAPRGRRDSSNVPAQALALLHDPLVVELAGATAERLLAEHDDGGARVEALWRLALGRAPRADERADALVFVRDAIAQAEAGGREPEDAAPSDPRAAAWADLAHVVFALEEFRFLR